MDPLLDLDGIRLLRSVVIDNAATRAQYLAPHRGTEHVRCLCKEEGIPMGVGHRRVPSEIYYLYPLHRSDGARHAFGCPHRTEPTDSGSATVERDVIEVDAEGLNLHLALASYQQPWDSPPGPKGADARGAGAKTRGELGTLSSLLEVLWSQSELNVWRPWFADARSYPVVRNRLLGAARSIRINGYSLAERFYIPRQFREDDRELINREFAEFAKRLRPDGDGRLWYGFVGGFVRLWDVRPSGNVGLRLRHSRDTFWVSRERWHEVRVREWRAMQTHQLDTTCPLFALAQIGWEAGERGGWYSVREMALMTLSDVVSWIPVSSMHQRQLILALVAAGRRFRRPLSIDSTELLPDAILEDRADRTHLEIVTLRTHHDHGTQTETKRRAYSVAHQAVWWWDPDSELVVPTLPPADRSLARGH